MTITLRKQKADPGSALANARMAAHSAFDPLWQRYGYSRGHAYQWLADQLGIDKSDCHMLYFDEATCLRVKGLCDAYTFKLEMGLV